MKRQDIHSPPRTPPRAACSTIRAPRGLTLVEVVVGVFVMTVVFLGLFGAFKLSIELVYSTKVKLGAVSLMSERMEYLRSLPYVEVGTAGGIPSGTVPQTESVSVNGTPYTLRTLVIYTDAPEDGTGIADENNITADYKTAKVEVLWSVKGVPRSVSLTSIITPSGVETLESGGTLEVRVLNALATAVPQASVRIQNATTVPPIDVSVSTNDGGFASFPGTPEASNYEIHVSKTGYSSAQTYSVTQQNPSPSPGNVSVVDQTTSTMTLFIDQVASLAFSTFEPAGDGLFLDQFDDQTKLSATSSVEVAGGALVLSEISPDVYASSGLARSNSVAPQYLSVWKELSLEYLAPPQTGAILHLYYFDGSGYVLVPDDRVAENSSGLPGGTYSLASLPPETYSSLQLGAELSSVDGAATPEILSWTLSYTAGPTPLPGVAFNIRGDKTIGFDGGGALLYKYTGAFTTDALGTWLIEGLEWDRYTMFLSGSAYDVVEMCSNIIDLTPGTHQGVLIFLENGTPNSLRVAIESSGTPISGAEVSITGPASGGGNSSACGQAYFGGLVSGAYTLSVTKTGFQPWTEEVSVAGDTVQAVSLSAL